MAGPSATTILENIDKAINAKVLGIALGEVKEFTIRDKRIIEFSLDELRGLRELYTPLAASEKIGGLRKVVIRNRGI